MRNLPRILSLLALSAGLAACSNSGSGGATPDAGEGGANGAVGGTSGGSLGGTTGSTGGRTGSGGTPGGTAGTPGSAGRGAGGAAAGVGGTTGGTDAGPPGTGGAVAGVGGGGGATPSVSVLQHHNNLSRDGLYVDARLTRTAAASLHVDATFANSPIMGPVRAQPLYLAGSGATPDLVIAATAQNRVYALNGVTGAAVWDVQVGTPVAPGTPGLCGNPLNPLGITGTPVIDATTRTIYFDAMTNVSNAARHMIHALDIDGRGTERAGWPIDVAATARSGATTFDPPIQNQRAALTLLGGKVFVPFGGHIGDCLGYHGWLVAVTTSGTPQVSAWATTAIAGGIWGTSGGASDGTSLFVSTGNTKAAANSPAFGTSPASWGGGEAVIKFPTTVAQPPLTQTTDYFFPMGWAMLDQTDADLGGTGPILLTVPGATPANLIIALGKDGNAYLLNRANLGGMDAQPLNRLAVAGGAIINAAASYRTATGSYVVLRNGNRPVGCPAGQSGGLTAIRISAASPPTMSIAWCGGPTNVGSPAVSVTDSSGADAIVWVVAGGNRLNGFNGDTGQSVFAGGGAGDALANVQSLQTPIVANGRVFVASDSRIYAFTP